MNNSNDLTLAQAIGFNIKKLRESIPDENGKTRSQRDCAETVGASQQQWAAWEAGKNIPGEDYLKGIAALFGVAKNILWIGQTPPAQASGADTGQGLESQITRTNRAFFSVVTTLQHVQLKVQEGRLPIETYRSLVEELLVVVQSHKVDLLSEPDEGSSRVS